MYSVGHCTWRIYIYMSLYYIMLFTNGNIIKLFRLKLYVVAS